jgi:hypothetical protein
MCGANILGILSAHDFLVEYRNNVAFTLPFPNIQNLSHFLNMYQLFCYIFSCNAVDINEHAAAYVKMFHICTAY